MAYPAARNRYQTFSSTDNPITGKRRLWRYLTFEKFVSLMETSRLHHARLDQMEDRFGGSVTKRYAEKRAAQKQSGPMLSHLEPINNRRIRYCSFVSCWYASDVELAAMWKLYSREHDGVAIVSTLRRMEEAVELPPEREEGMLGPVEYLNFEKGTIRICGDPEQRTKNGEFRTVPMLPTITGSNGLGGGDMASAN